VDADQVISFVVGRGFVGEDIPPHQVPHDEELCPSRDNGESYLASFIARSLESSFRR
jgi:hypothetical protein